MEQFDKLIALLRGDFLIFKKDSEEKHQETLKALGDLSTELSKANDPIAKSIDTLSQTMKDQKTPEVNVPAPIVNVTVPDVVVPEIQIPEIVIPPPIVTVEVPDVIVPEIKIPEITIPAPIVNVPAPIVNIPDEMEVKGFKAWATKILDAIKSITPYSIHNEATYENPVKVILIDKKGRPYTAEQLFSSPGGSGGGSTGGVVTEMDYALRLDEASATITYIGKASTGSDDASAVWSIKRMNTASGLEITWADGDALFDNVWDDRAILSYS